MVVKCTKCGGEVFRMCCIVYGICEVYRMWMQQLRNAVLVFSIYGGKVYRIM